MSVAINDQLVRAPAPAPSFRFQIRDTYILSNRNWLRFFSEMKSQAWTLRQLGAAAEILRGLNLADLKGFLGQGLGPRGQEV